MEVRLRTFVFVFVLFLVVLFAAVNWPLFMELNPINVLVTTVLAPLGVIMLAVVAGLTVMYLVLVAKVETGALLGSRKTARELEETRRLALSAEESRLNELRTEVHERLDGIETTLDAVLARLETDEVQAALRPSRERLTDRPSRPARGTGEAAEESRT